MTAVGSPIIVESTTSEEEPDVTSYCAQVAEVEVAATPAPAITSKVVAPAAVDRSGTSPGLGRSQTSVRKLCSAPTGR